MQPLQVIVTRGLGSQRISRNLWISPAEVTRRACVISRTVNDRKLVGNTIIQTLREDFEFPISTYWIRDDILMVEIPPTKRQSSVRRITRWVEKTIETYRDHMQPSGEPLCTM